MRKLLILMLVLGMASMASAVPIITGATTIAPGQTVTLTVEGTSAEASTTVDGTGGFSTGIFIDIMSQSAYAYYKAPIGLWTGSTVGSASAANANMGGGASITSPYYFGIWLIASPDVPWDEATDVDTGTWFTFDVTLNSGYSGLTDGSVYMPIDMGKLAVVGGTSIQVVPEPVTIVLLGLGGLFLRRRR